MRHQALFDHVMSNGLRDWLDSQATAREEAKRRNLQILMIGMGIAVAAAVAVMGFMPDQAEYGFVVGAVIGAIAWGVANLPVQAMSKQIKVRANEELGAALGLRYQLDGVPGGDFELATRMGLLPSSPDQANYSDFWEGTFGASEGTLHEAHLQEYQGEGKNRRLVTVFQGVVMGYQFSRPFTSTTLVRQDMGLFNGLFNLGSRMTGLKLEPVKMVHPDFERRFEVVSTDQVEARYLLHPAFCERLMEMEAAFNGHNMRLAFAQGRVVVVIETRDMFESGGIDAEGDDARFATTIDQLGSLIDLTQTLNERAR
ncbi:MAG: DUF3137 domain-containing protein [Aquidulcibacter sp.]|jgi:hypothetical protein|uniref:DUF3137 domain-containing protein n=1 Tax=Aquidulcibacter sp. TaxID=2052990 RepID=UPI0022BEE83B|nr:DUF3137 domain-containing protein [Aquidulcibacter sp.]MCZ8208651.1 DUF3137 domain-containing protein [Aquidulcibacter sp.]